MNEYTITDGLGSVRTEAAPKKTITAYKLMRLVDGQLYPLFVDRSAPVQMGVWYNADAPALDVLQSLDFGYHLIDLQTQEVIRHADSVGKADVKRATANNQRWIHVIQQATKIGYKQVGISESNGSEVKNESYSYRPGWHCGELPVMNQVAKKKTKTFPGYLPEDCVFVEVEISADVDYNAEARANGGELYYIPKNGYYVRCTNADKKAAQADECDWYIAGAVRLNRIISDREARQIIDRYNRKHGTHVVYSVPRESGKMFNADTMRLEDEHKSEIENMTEDEIAIKLTEIAEPYREIEFSKENFFSEFPNNECYTPKGLILVKYSQFEKLYEKTREKYFGLIKPTLEKPCYIIQHKDGELFVKSFIDYRTKTIVFFAVAKTENSQLILCSAHEKRIKQLLNKIKEGNITFDCENSPTALNGANSPLPSYIAVCVGIPFEDKYTNNFDTSNIFSKSAPLPGTQGLGYNDWDGPEVGDWFSDKYNNRYFRIDEVRNATNHSPLSYKVWEYNADDSFSAIGTKTYDDVKNCTLIDAPQWYTDGKANNYRLAVEYFKQHTSEDSIEDWLSAPAWTENGTDDRYIIGISLSRHEVVTAYQEAQKELAEKEKPRSIDRWIDNFVDKEAKKLTIEQRRKIEEHIREELRNGVEDVEQAIENVRAKHPELWQTQTDEKISLREMWTRLKAKHSDRIFLFREGDFYTAYFGDAIMVARALNVTLTQSGDTKMASFPQTELDTYLPKLVKAGLRVAVADGLPKEILTEEEKAKLRSYSGKGGSKDTTERGILDEYYTPDYVCEFMYQLAVRYGYTAGKVLEPSCATGNCIRPIYERNDYTHIDAFEINQTSREICKKLYPYVKIYENYFETAFLEPPRYTFKAKKTWLENAPYDLIIGNPPYGKHVNRYSSYFKGKDRFAQVEMFFMYKCLELLRSGGLLVFITSINFMSTGSAYQEAKNRIGEIAELVDAYRLPKVFEKTDICTDIIVLRKK